MRNSACATCSTTLRANARFCDTCGAPVTSTAPAAEYKQATMLFADVVHSMQLAEVLDSERLREIMSAVFNRSATVVQRYGGTVDKFTGDGIMALFGAPITLEDHAFRACLAALDIQNEMTRLASETSRLDGVQVQLRIGLNSGQVIAGDIDDGAGGYTAVGLQVGIAQRMESVAAPGGISISESTAHLVSHAVMLGEPESVHVKGAEDPMTAYRLLGTGDPGRHRRHVTQFVGRGWEFSALTGLLDQAIGGAGAVVGIVGEPGIGKSRMVSELTDAAARRGAEVFSTYCEAHATDIPLHAVARLLRAVFGVNGADPETARTRLRAILSGAAADDLLLLYDLLGIGDPATSQPDIDPDARRRRLTALINTASLERTTPTVYVIEDAHWIDEVSDSMLADFVSVTPQTPSLVVTTYRPEYRGELTRIPRSQTIALSPLTDSVTRSLTGALLGNDATIEGLAARIAGRAAGNPFFVEEIVRELAERGVIAGRRGEYVAHRDIADISVPSTLHATIAARVDRLDAVAKHTLTSAAAIGSRFSADLLTRLVTPTDLPALVDAELIDQVMFTPRAEYAFRHPLIRTVAYESQLKSTRADLHRRLATTIETDAADAVEENAALIAEHLQSAGDLHAAFGWHMRAAGWSQYRDLGAATTSWQRARDVADSLPADDPNRPAMRIAPRTLLCGNAWRTRRSLADAQTGFDELRELTERVSDKVSLAIGMTGWVTALAWNDKITESAQLASEYVALVESLGQPAVTVGLLPGALQATLQVCTTTESLRLAQRVIDLAGGDPAFGNLVIGSPLTIALMSRGFAEAMLGRPGFTETLDAAIAAARPVDTTCFAAATVYKHCWIPLGGILADDSALRDGQDALTVAEQSGDHFAYGCGLLARGIALFYHDRGDSDLACELLTKARDLGHSTHRTFIRIADIHLAMRKMHTGDLDGAIDLAGAVIATEFESGDRSWLGKATDILVDALLQRHTDTDVAEAQSAIDRLAVMPVEPGFVLFEIPLLRMRAQLARTRGDESGYREFAGRYRIRAAECGYAGHVALAEAMLRD